MQAAFTTLLEKYLAGELSQGERGLLQEMIQDPQYEETALEFMRDAFHTMEAGKAKAAWTVKMEDSVLDKIKSHESKPVLLRRKATRYYTALALALVVGFPGWFITKDNSKTTVVVASKKTGATPPASRSGAILALSNGVKIRLDSVADGMVAKEGNVEVAKHLDEIAYIGEAGKGGNNILQTPTGKRWSVRLADGTKIWLNSASSISYPASFAKDKRLVAIVGEAYLEVAHDASRPFEVALPNGATVRVLGTHFSVSAYPNEKTVKAVLLEGSIAFAHGSNQIIIKPGEQARYDEARNTVEKGWADTTSVSAWRNGVLRFENRDVTAVMRQLQRWYDIDVKYEGPASPLLYGGEMQVSLSLAQVIEVLHTMGIHCRLEGKTVTVTS